MFRRDLRALTPFLTLVIGLFKVYEEKAAFLIAHVKFAVATLSTSLGAVFLRVEVILSGLASQNLAIFGDFEALEVRFVGLDSHGT